MYENSNKELDIYIIEPGTHGQYNHWTRAELLSHCIIPSLGKMLFIHNNSDTKRLKGHLCCKILLLQFSYVAKLSRQWKTSV